MNQKKTFAVRFGIWLREEMDRISKSNKLFMKSQNKKLHAKKTTI